MSTPKNKPIVTLPELVETQNIYRSIERLTACGYEAPAKRAILHACAMFFNDAELQGKLREALRLP